MHFDFPCVSFHPHQRHPFRIKTERTRTVVACPRIPAFEHVGNGRAGFKPRDNARR